MLKILEKVATARQELNSDDYTIQLSECLMDKLTTELIAKLRKCTADDKEAFSGKIGFQLVFFGKLYTIIPARESSNSSDVEEVLYNLASKYLSQ